MAYIWRKAMCAIFVIPIHCADSVKLLNAKHLFMIHNLMKMITYGIKR